MVAFFLSPSPPLLSHSYTFPASRATSPSRMPCHYKDIFSTEAVFCHFEISHSLLHPLPPFPLVYWYLDASFLYTASLWSIPPRFDLPTAILLYGIFFSHPISSGLPLLYQVRRVYPVECCPPLHSNFDTNKLYPASRCLTPCLCNRCMSVCAVSSSPLFAHINPFSFLLRFFPHFPPPPRFDPFCLKSFYLTLARDSSLLKVDSTNLHRPPIPSLPRLRFQRAPSCSVPSLLPATIRRPDTPPPLARSRFFCPSVLTTSLLSAHAGGIGPPTLLPRKDARHPVNLFFFISRSPSGALRHSSPIASLTESCIHLFPGTTG